MWGATIVFPSVYHEVIWLFAMILVFWMLTFKPTFSLSSFIFIKRHYSSSLLSAIKVVSSAWRAQKISIVVKKKTPTIFSFLYFPSQQNFTNIFFHVHHLQLLSSHSVLNSLPLTFHPKSSKKTVYTSLMLNPVLSMGRSIGSISPLH